MKEENGKKRKKERCSFSLICGKACALKTLRNPVRETTGVALSAAGAYWTAVYMCVIERERERVSRTRPFHTVALIKATMLFI